MTAVLRRLLLAVALALLLTAGPPQDPAAARSQGAAARMRVQHLAGTVAPDGRFRLRVRVRNPTADRLDDLRVLASIHHPVTSRFAYHRAVDDGEVGGLWDTVDTDVGSLAPGQGRAVTLTADSQDLGFDDPAAAGVYPLQIHLLRAGETVQRIGTSVVAVGDVQRPLRLTLLLALDGPPSRRADGTLADTGVVAAAGEGGRLHRLVDPLTRRRMPVTIATSGLGIEQVAELAETRASVAAQRLLDDVREVGQRPSTDQLAMAYGPADLVALARNDLALEAIRHVTHGLSTVEHITGIRALPDTYWPPDGINGRTVAEVLSPAGIDRYVLSERYLALAEDRDLSHSPSPVRPLRTAAGTPTMALVPDPWLTESLATADVTDGVAVAAQRIVAETAATYFERPNAEEQRGLLITAPQLWKPPGRLLDGLLAKLGAAPWLAPVTLDELARTVTPEQEPVRVAYPREALARELPAPYLSALADARTDAEWLSRVLAGDEDVLTRYDRMLLTASSVHFRGALREVGRAMIRTVSDAADDLYAAIDVDDGAPVTLTSVDGQLPVTLRNRSERGVDVTVHLETNRYALTGDGTGGKRVRLAPDSAATVTFDVRALSPGGTAPIGVVVTDPGAMETLARGRIVVHSTAYPLTALLITAGAAGFLVVWWVRDARARRRGARSTARERAAA